MTSDVFALDIDEDVEGDALPFVDRPDSDVAVLHFALPSPLTAALAEAPGKKVVIYHNITPPEFFRGYDDELVRISTAGTAELATLAECCDLALGDSEFNRLELEELGFGRTGVLPILMDFEPFRNGEPGPVMEEILSDGRANFLFVGRVYPNKRFEDLARLAFSTRSISPKIFGSFWWGKPAGWSVINSRSRRSRIDGASGRVSFSLPGM